MSGMAGVHLRSRGAFTSRGAKPNGLEFDAHGLKKETNSKRGDSATAKGSWVSPFCLCIKIWHTLLYNNSLAFRQVLIITSDVMVHQQFIQVCFLRCVDDGGIPHTTTG